MTSKKLCPVCESTAVRVERPSPYKYDNVGLSNVVLVGQGVRITHCADCRNTTTTVSDEQQLLQVLGLTLLQKPPGLTGEELRYLRTLFGLTQAELGKALHVPRRETVAEWEAKERIFSSARDEITPRLLLLHLYRERVLDSEHCFLQPSHEEAYEEYVESFVEHVWSMLKNRIDRSPAEGFTVRRQPRKKQWSPDPRLFQASR